MTPKKRRLLWGGLAAAVVVCAALVYYLFFAAFVPRGGSVYAYIDDDDTYDSVLVKLERDCGARQLAGFRLLAAATGYADRAVTGPAKDCRPCNSSATCAAAASRPCV